MAPRGRPKKAAQPAPLEAATAPPAPATPAPPPAPATIRCRVIVPNVWSSLGKHLRGDIVDIPADEARVMDDRDQIKIVR